MIIEAKFLPITPSVIPENFFLNIKELLKKSNFLIYRVEENLFSIEHWEATKRIYEDNNGFIILHSNLRKYVPQENNIHLTSKHLMESDKKNVLFAGASCHNENEVKKALELDLDYILISPIKKLPNKNSPLGWERFSKLASLFPGPSFALGGMNLNDLNEAKLYGAQGIAGIRSFFNLQND